MVDWDATVSASAQSRAAALLLLRVNLPGTVYWALRTVSKPRDTPVCEALVVIRCICCAEEPTDTYFKRPSSSAGSTFLIWPSSSAGSTFLIWPPS